jgi:NADPH:quinone reductase-like Zn-dependent oxidoreductase
MRSYQLEKLGDPTGIVERDREPQTVGPHDICVRVRAASINKRDLFILKGTYPLPSKPGVVPLSDGAGDVVSVGERVTR